MRNKRLSNSIRDVKDEVFEIRNELSLMREENRRTSDTVDLMYKKLCEDNQQSESSAGRTYLRGPNEIGGDKSIQ